VSEARSAVSFAPSEGPVLQLSSSEEVDVLIIETGEFEDSPPHSSALSCWDVVTPAVAKLKD